MIDQNYPKAFISYSWDDAALQGLGQATGHSAEADGVDVTLDRWHAAPGDQIPAFMERAVRENDFVIAICTPRFKEKSDERWDGVGYEGDIKTVYALNGGDEKKFIPVLRRGSWERGGADVAARKVSLSISEGSRIPSLNTTISAGRCTMRGKEATADRAASGLWGGGGKKKKKKKKKKQKKKNQSRQKENRRTKHAVAAGSLSPAEKRNFNVPRPGLEKAKSSTSSA